MTHNNERDELRGTLANTICNASFYPERARPRLLGGDMSEVLDRTTDSLLAAGYVKPRQVSSVEELDALPIRSIVAAITHSRNVPIVIVFQRGSIEHGGDGWCTPEAIGQIPSEAVFEFIALNGLPTVFTVLTDGGSL